MRMDSWPKNGGHPGSDLPLMREQLLDLFDVAYGLLAPLVGGAGGERNVEFGAAMATAVQRMAARPLVRPRPPAARAPCRSTSSTAEAAIAEIEKRAGDRRFAQVNIPPARPRTARTPPLLADPASLRRQRFPGLAAPRRHQRSRLHRRRLAVLLS